MSYHHYTIEERCCLREYYKKGYSYPFRYLSHSDRLLSKALSY